MGLSLGHSRSPLSVFKAFNNYRLLSFSDSMHLSMAFKLQGETVLLLGSGTIDCQQPNALYPLFSKE